MDVQPRRRGLTTRFTVRGALGAAVLLVAASLTAVVTTAPSARAAINPADFQQVTLARGESEVGEPMTISVLPDRSVLHTARNGTLRRTAADGTTSVIGTIPVYNHDEEGLQGVAADPGFATNRFIYLYYAPPLNTPAGDAPATGTDADWTTWTGVNRLARFTLKADFTLDPASAVTVLDVPANRGICCHVGGDIDFDAAGNLYLTTGRAVQVFDKAGQRFETIPVPEGPTNVVFGGKDMQTLFITARTGLYGVKMRVKGVGPQ